jgi:23S rRNA (pseudouridine1915-N3)-methyltransferase
VFWGPVKLQFYYIQSSKETWSEEAQSLYSEKLKRFYGFQLEGIKSKKIDREDSELKRKQDSADLLNRIEPTDLVILFDERGKAMTSVQFANHLLSHIESGKKRIVFLVGGPYGITDEIRKRAQSIVSLSTFVMNHHVALITALEQIYRSSTIIRKTPYHNA